MSGGDEQGYGLVMPFVTVTSKGGPYDDLAYAAGWAMGVLDLRLAELQPVTHAEAVRSDDVSQADLVAMKNGYQAKPVETDVDGWHWVEFARNGDLGGDR